MYDHVTIFVCYIFAIYFGTYTYRTIAKPNFTISIRMDTTTPIKRISPFTILRVLGGIFINFDTRFCKQTVKIRIRHNAVSDQDLHCLPMCPIKRMLGLLTLYVLNEVLSYSVDLEAYYFDSSFIRFLSCECE